MNNELLFRAKDRKERSEEEFFDAITRAFEAEGMDIDREDMRTALEDAKQYKAIVHCKDCKWWLSPYGCAHEDALITATANDFCSYGAKMEE